MPSAHLVGETGPRDVSVTGLHHHRRQSLSCICSDTTMPLLVKGRAHYETALLFSDKGHTLSPKEITKGSVLVRVRCDHAAWQTAPQPQWFTTIYTLILVAGLWVCWAQ